MTPLWIAKHQLYVPSVFISFFSFTSDPNLNSLNDNQLKSEINSVQGMIQNSDFKTRYAVVLLSDKTISEAPDIEERLAVIRRATGLDPKTSLFFLPPNASRVEISTFVNSVLMALQPSCIEYYRDLTKHARRKKARGTIPPPTAPPMTGRSQTLHAEGWAVRYEFKLGVLAEFRQEMDAACRHYITAQDILLGDDGLFRSTPSWSPRWDESRLLTDTIALRVIRCLIWNNFPTHAVQSWLNYRNRIRRILDECGKGATNYGWEAWQSRWAKVMAELIQKANVPIFSLPSSKQSRALEREICLHVPAEKAIPLGERLNPWTLLHHPGYWLRISAAHAVSRRLLAENLPEEDRVAPAFASASQLSNRAHVYDSYLCPEPHAEFPLPGNEGFNHANDVVSKFNAAIREFSARGQKRLADKLSLDIGKELADAGRFDEALDILKPLWTSMSWRSEGWWPHVSEVSYYLRDCASQLKDAEVLLATEWELLHHGMCLITTDEQSS
jgi:trafficking protein particle complex subunit 11